MASEDDQSKLPEQCYTVSDSGLELILLKRGELGYYHTAFSTQNEAENRALASKLNTKLGVTCEQEQAMLFGSLFGWDLPGADPGLYGASKQAVPAEPNSVTLEMRLNDAKVRSAQQQVDVEKDSARKEHGRNE